jgi:predicted alpha/beta superfamily hydrolase
MKPMLKKQFSMLLLLFILIRSSILFPQEQPGKSQPVPVTLHRTEIIKLKSEINGRSYPINIALPGSYYTTDRTYPVVYLLDAYSSFGIVTEMARLLASSKEMPEIILVGISSEGGSKEFVYNRSIDFTPTRIPEEKLAESFRAAVPASGGAEKFFRFIRQELIPLIESGYRVKPGDRTLAGHSLGGLFVFYSLFKDTSLFYRYVAISPALLWDDEYILKEEQKYFESGKNLTALVYTEAGLKEEETFLLPWKRLTSKITERGYSGLILKSEIAAGETHYSIIPHIITHGLKSVFEMTPRNR